MTALRLVARKLAVVGPRASMNIQPVIGSSSRPATATAAAAATGIEEGQRRLLSISSCSNPIRRFSSGASDPPPEPEEADLFGIARYMHHHKGPDPPPYVEQAELEALKTEVEQKKEELFYKIAQLDYQWKSRRCSQEAKMDRSVLRVLIDHVKPNPDDQLWRRYTYIKTLNTGLRVVLFTFTATMLVALSKGGGA
uniref:Uncharacterized protein n=1 Tax=Leersia perrieri TaxID=77586 RepID=A0A0D9VB82_9ORYZ